MEQYKIILPILALICGTYLVYQDINGKASNKKVIVTDAIFIICAVVTTIHAMLN